MAPNPSLDLRAPVISATHKGPVVNLVSWIAVTTMALAVATVLSTKLMVFRKIKCDDLFLSAAMIFSIAFIAAINMQVANGLGSLHSTLSEDDFDSFQRAGYASDILYIIALFCGKASTLILLINLVPTMDYQLPSIIVASLVTVWAVFAIFGSAFQCSLPKPWLYASGKCFHQVAFWDAVAVVDIVTDLAITILPIWLIHNLQIPLRKKIAVCFGFSFRLWAVGCVIFRMVELPKLFARTTDLTFESWIPTIATILEVFFSIFAACVPHLRPFMESIQAGYLSGVIQENEDRFRSGDTTYVVGNSVSRNKASISVEDDQAISSTKFQSLSLANGGRREAWDDNYPIDQTFSSHTTVIEATGGGPEAHARHDSEGANSAGGNSNDSFDSKAMIIQTTKGWSVSYQDNCDT